MDLILGGHPSATSPSSDLIAAGSSSKNPSFDVLHKFGTLEKRDEAVPTSLTNPSRKNEINPVVQDPEEGWTEVKPRKKSHKLGRVGPHEVTPEPPVVVCDNEVPWGAKFGGSLRKIRRWSQVRRTAVVMTSTGLGYVSYGSYGPAGLES